MSKINRNLRLRDEAVTRVRDLWSSARIFGLTSAEVTERKRAIIDNLRNKRVPLAYIAFVEGVDWQISHDMYASGTLIYGGFAAGKFLSNQSRRADYYELNGCPPARFGELERLGHYWECRGEMRPFFVAEG